MRRIALYFLSLFHVSIVSMVSVFFIVGSLGVDTAFAQSDAYVRVIHASPFVGTADVFVDGQKLLSSFQFASVTDYVAVPQGVHKVQIALVGKGINAAVITQDLTIAAGDAYTVAALGSSPNALSLQVFSDNNLVVPNQAKVRVYHLSPDAGKVNVSVGEETTLNNVGYPYASEYLSQGVGPCTFTFTDPQFHTALPLTTTLRANTVTSVFAVGLYQGNPKVQIVEAQTAGIPGLPGTGSDPAPVSSQSNTPVLPWAAGVIVLALIGSTLVMRCIKRVR